MLVVEMVIEQADAFNHGAVTGEEVVDIAIARAIGSKKVEPLAVISKIL